MSFFEAISLLPEDPIFGLYATFRADPRPNKINLSIGIYQDEQGKVPLLECVRQAEALDQRAQKGKEYLPQDGHQELLQEALSLLFGPHRHSSLVPIQAVGGTGGLRMGGEFLAEQGFTTLFLPEPSWPNHAQVFERAGLKIASYTYYDSVNQCLDFAGMCRSLLAMPPRSILLLHSCCHNPTGMDLSPPQWQEIAALAKKQRLLPFFDSAYQGFGEGIEEDVRPIRLFAEQGLEMLVSCSFSKNFSLYGERVGVLCVATQEEPLAKKIASHLKPLIRASYSTPPSHGARLVAKILQTPHLRHLWEEELGAMRARIGSMRGALLETLPGLRQQRGLFFMSGLNPQQVRILREEKALYLLDNGRINLAGLNPGNCDRVAQALLSV